MLHATKTNLRCVGMATTTHVCMQINIDTLVNANRKRAYLLERCVMESISDERLKARVYNQISNTTNPVII